MASTNGEAATQFAVVLWVEVITDFIHSSLPPVYPPCSTKLSIKGYATRPSELKIGPSPRIYDK